MKNLLLFLITFIFSITLITAQKSIQLTHYKTIELTNGKWSKWPTKWSTAKTQYDYPHTLSVKKLDSEIYQLQLDQGGSSSGIFKENVIYDPEKTKEIRKSQSDENLTAYRYTGSQDYFWTENITLKAITSNPSLWNSTKNAKVYIWNKSLGSATLYSTVDKPISKDQKYQVRAKATRTKYKGDWAAWSDWKSMSSNSYFKIGVITENKVYNFMYYENGKVIKDFNITYDNTKTKTIREKYKNASAYKINTSDGEWIYVLHTSMGNIVSNPNKWNDEKNKMIYLGDYKNSGMQTRIK